MLAFDPYRELRNGKRYKTTTDHKMSENGSIEDNRVGNSTENTEEEIPEVRILTQEKGQRTNKRVYRHPHTSAREIGSAGSGDDDNTASEPLPKG